MNCHLLTMNIPVIASKHDKYLSIIELYHTALYDKSENKPAFFLLVLFLITVVFLIKFFIKTLKTSC